MSPARMRAIVIGVLAVALVTTSASLPARAAPHIWPPLPAFDTNIAWSDCGDGWQCATLTVPVDWRKPAGDTVGLALIRRPATAPDERLGALLVNPGGPGVGGTGYVRTLVWRLPDVVEARFDLVSWDPRGTGASRAVDCVDDAFLDLGTAAPAVPDSAETLKVVRRYNRAFARGCTERSGAYAGQIGTRNSARDLEAIRIALGEPTLNYLGFSYGTVLGMTYAQMFPTAVRAMVLDAPPDYWLGQLAYAHQQAQGFMQALEAFLGWCEENTTCALRDAGAPRDTFTQLLDRVNASPIPAEYTVNGETRTGMLTASLFVTAVIAMLYDESRGWPALGRVLRAGAYDDAGPLLSLADSRLGRNIDGTWASLVEANAVISCVDRPDPKPRSAALELADVARFQSELPPWGGGWAVSGCAGMPKPAHGDKLGDVRVTGSAPILVVGTTGDPATPYAGAGTMVSRIAGSGLLTFESTEHTAYGSGRSTCIDDAVDAYLIDRVMPALGTRCSAG
ncbi:MAG: alpha/beta hydrolase [Acidimicrobiia bacterium]